MSNSNPVSCRRVPQFLRRGAILLLCFLATSTLSPVFAESQAVVRSASLTLDAAQDVYELNAKVDITLPEEARKAIEAGLTLRFVYEIELSRVRGYWPDATVADLEQTYELSYHALSQRYLVRNLNTGEQQDFGYAAGGARAAWRRARPAGHRRRAWSRAKAGTRCTCAP